MPSKERMVKHIKTHVDDSNHIFDWVQHRPHQLSFLRKFCGKGFVIKIFNNCTFANCPVVQFLVQFRNAYSDGNKTNYDESICGIASYFCTSDGHNNFTARRPPTFYYDALEKCRIENSSLISSKSATDIALAKKGFNIHRKKFFEFSEITILKPF